tara:strand:+ start:1260 stop:1910 length:651 start_codon:yes stop_codon:yes gene_type:complete
MPEIEVDEEEEQRWIEELADQYEGEARTGMHVSDLTLCLRQSPLNQLYQPKWDLTTLFRFRMGNALEKAFFKLLLPVATEEMEVICDGIEGHIDFGHDPYDYECKLTWGSPPKNPESLLDSKHWWFSQMAAYAFIRERVKMRLTVLFLVPIPRLKSYMVKWEEDELEDLWEMFIERKVYKEKKAEQGLFPSRTAMTWLCKGCPVKQPCDALSARGE